jgi:hypothetical protein
VFEDFEEEAPHGLTCVVKALSFEFTIIQRDVALASIERCIALGYTRFNATLGESARLVNADWMGGEAIARWLTTSGTRQKSCFRTIRPSSR